MGDVVAMGIPVSFECVGKDGEWEGQIVKGTLELYWFDTEIV